MALSTMKWGSVSFDVDAVVSDWLTIAPKESGLLNRQSRCQSPLRQLRIPAVMVSDFQPVKTSVKTPLPVPRDDARYPTRPHEWLLSTLRLTKLLGWRISEGEPFLRRILRRDQLDDASIGRCALYGTP